MLVRNMKLSEFTLSSAALRCRSARAAVSPSFQSASPDRVQNWIARNAGHTTAYDVHPPSGRRVSCPFSITASIPPSVRQRVAQP